MGQRLGLGGHVALVGVAAVDEGQTRQDESCADGQGRQDQGIADQAAAGLGHVPGQTLMVGLSQEEGHQGQGGDQEARALGGGHPR